MFKDFRKKIAHFVAHDYLDTLIKGVTANEMIHKDLIEKIANQKVAEILLKIDPLEYCLKEFHGIFSEEFDKPENNLDDQSRLRLSMWAYSQKDDVQARFLSDWIMNTAGNALVKLTNPNPATTGYYRSQIANEITRRKEIGRLSLYYEGIIKKKDEEFDSGVGVEL